MRLDIHVCLARKFFLTNIKSSAQTKELKRGRPGNEAKMLHSAANL